MAGGFALEDQLAIRILVEAYNDAVMRFDEEAWASTWARDGVWVLEGREPIAGRAAIVAVWRDLMGNFSSVGFFSQPAAIVVEGDTGRAAWWQQEQLHHVDGSWMAVLGHYTDEYVREADGWRFARRAYRVVDRRKTG